MITNTNNNNNKYYINNSNNNRIRPYSSHQHSIHLNNNTHNNKYNQAYPGRLNSKTLYNCNNISGNSNYKYNSIDVGNRIHTIN